MIKIYTLSHPLNGEVRYIGMTTKTLTKRLSGHIYDTNSNKKKTHKINWISSLLKQDLKPIITLLDETNEKDFWQLEQYWISQFISWGFDLVNSTEGGETPTTKPGNLNPNYGNKYREDLKTTKGRVVQLDLLGNFIRSVNCAEEFEKFNFVVPNIGKCLRKERNQYKGFQFIYEIDYDTEKCYKHSPVNTQKKSIVKLTMEGKFIQFFESQREAGDKKGKIGQVCRGLKKSYKGHKWMYLEDYQIKI